MSLADVTDPRFTADQLATVATFETAVTPPEVREVAVAVGRVAAALRQRAREATDTPCDMDCDPEDCASCGRPIQAFSFINDIPDTIFGDVEAIAAAAVAAYRATGGAEEAVRRVEAVLAEAEERNARYSNPLFGGFRFSVSVATSEIRTALAPQAVR